MQNVLITAVKCYGMVFSLTRENEDIRPPMRTDIFYYVVINGTNDLAQFCC